MGRTCSARVGNQKRTQKFGLENLGEVYGVYGRLTLIYILESRVRGFEVDSAGSNDRLL
jgi:hypothetical protein